MITKIVGTAPTAPALNPVIPEYTYIDAFSRPESLRHPAVLFWHGGAAVQTQPAQDLGRDHEGCTPLMYAVIGRHLAGVQSLLRNKEDIHAVDSRGRTVLHYAVMSGNHAMLKTLLTQGAHPDAADDAGSTPMMVAALFGHYDLAKLLLARGATPLAADRSGRTAQQLALAAGDKRMAEIFA